MGKYNAGIYKNSKLKEIVKTGNETKKTVVNGVNTRDAQETLKLRKALGIVNYKGK